jgi:hypothetical protein
LIVRCHTRTTSPCAGWWTNWPRTGARCRLPVGLGVCPCAGAHA